jgi:hypothetical protein
MGGEGEGWKKRVGEMGQNELLDKGEKKKRKK